ncbi:MAG: phosphate regulon sensor histidine kinase PhoR [Burkholderiales bacterium]|nr:phosphate regulon sensor histidine kinase PhoR [Burkholderiales bacterium]
MCVGGGAALGWWADTEAGAAFGVGAGAVAWIVIDTTQALRTLRWLRAPDVRDVPRLMGLWAEAADRIRRALAVRERQARDAELRLEDFLDAIRASPNGVVLLDAQGRIEWCNLTASEHLGLDPERDLQQHIVNLLRDPDFTAFFHGRNRTQDVVVPAPGSTSARPRKLSLNLHSYGEGRLLLLSRDVTSVEQAEVMRRDFVANVSHEIRTPLTVLAGFVETLQSLDLPKDERSRYLQMMAQQAQRMQTLVSDLLTLSRLEGSPPPSSGEWTPAATFFGQCEQEARALAAALGKKLDLRFPPPAPLAFAGAASELQSAFSNLVSNAVRYTPSGGVVEVQLREEGGRALWSVRDTGPGIAPEHLPRLTERFYRVDRSRSRETGGTGLGLAIVKHVVQRHGGELRIESSLGVGSIFTICLSAARVRPLDAATPAGGAARPATESAAG